jgi:hypothetical protein
VKRWATRKRICVFLLLVGGGAIVNIAVAAIGFAIPIGDQMVGSSGFPPNDDKACSGFWKSHTSTGWPKQPAQIRLRTGVFARRWDLTHSSSLRFNGPPNAVDLAALEAQGDFSVCVIHSGAPLRAVSWHDWNGRPQSARYAATRGNDGLRITDAMAIPVHVLWPGFAINTLFYAGILWLIFAAPFALRRRRRIKRGLCPACAYPVGASDVCTECGAPHTVKRLV